MADVIRVLLLNPPARQVQAQGGGEEEMRLGEDTAEDVVYRAPEGLQIRANRAVEVAASALGGAIVWSAVGGASALKISALGLLPFPSNP